MRCPRCGNENPEANRFCGMCGASLLEVPAGAPGKAGASADALVAPAVEAAPSAALPVMPAPPISPRPAPPPEQSPVISGPSFLGLNQPAPLPRRRGSLSIDPQSAPGSSNLDYLLQDEDEEPKRGGAAKFFLILIALALAVGFGYLRWKGQGLPWLASGAAKPSSAAHNADAPDSDSPPPSSSATNSAPPPAAQTAPATTDTPPSVVPVPAAPAANPATLPAASTPVPAAAGSPPASDSGSHAASATKPPPAPRPNKVQHDDPNRDSNQDPKLDPNVSAPITPAHPRLAPSRPTPLVKPAPATDPVADAQKFIYGRGVRQDCDRGLRILKPAVDQANPKAMIEMGALYSAGLCTPRDLPTSYRWFALALRKDPDNRSLQADLQKLWGEMTQPERQLAIKLSQ